MNSCSRGVFSELFTCCIINRCLSFGLWFLTAKSVEPLALDAESRKVAVSIIVSTMVLAQERDVVDSKRVKFSKTRHAKRVCKTQSQIRHRNHCAFSNHSDWPCSLSSK